MCDDTGSTFEISSSRAAQGYAASGNPFLIVIPAQAGIQFDLAPDQKQDGFRLPPE
jgi:hypothetical protein